MTKDEMLNLKIGTYFQSSATGNIYRVISDTHVKNADFDDTIKLEDMLYNLMSVVNYGSDNKFKELKNKDGQF